MRKPFERIMYRKLFLLNVFEVRTFTKDAVMKKICKNGNLGNNAFAKGNGERSVYLLGKTIQISFL